MNTIPTHHLFVDKTGRRFGRLVVREYAGKIGGVSCWLCDCDCGESTTVRTGNLVGDTRTTSCGCAATEICREWGKNRWKSLVGASSGHLTCVAELTEYKCECICECGKSRIVSRKTFQSGEAKSCGCKNSIHRMSSTPMFRLWAGMMSRCYCPSDQAFKHYGGRGIMVCARWRQFENFLADMGNRPKGMSLDRINNDGHYEPDNCRWATSKQQCRNKRTNRMITHAGRTMCLADWSKEAGIDYATIHGRLRKGWSFEMAITTPPLKTGRLKLVR